MRAIFSGILAVALVLFAAGAFIVLIVGWFSVCDKIWDSGHEILAAFLTPMAFGGYALIVAIFCYGYSEWGGNKP